MFASRNLHKKSFKSLSSLINRSSSKNALILKAFSSYAIVPNDRSQSESSSVSSPAILVPFDTWRREMSSWQPRGPPIGRSMRSKVERRMQNETGKTMREVRRAKKIQKKLMTENERLVFNLKRAKKKVAVLLQKLKKYELPDLPQPVHDPELLTPEQLQAYKKIGFKNKNYVPVGVRGVFGGVVQNMHMHWKFHETVQVCCDNFPKEKIKEMASIIARLSGGVVVNIHKVKTIIMFRGRNYRQPQNLIPLNTLTKRKALFKARFEQALESQKLNVKKIEQQLRRSGINPEDPAASASIQRVASSFFNAIDNRDGTPYVFRSTDLSLDEHGGGGDELESLEPSDEREKVELDRFIADIEDAAEREWADEEALEKQKEMEMGERLMYRNKEQFGGRYRRTRDDGGEDFDDRDRMLRRDRNRINRAEERSGAVSDGENPMTWRSDGESDDDGGSYGRDRIAQRQRGTIVPYDQRENRISGRRRHADEEFDSGDSCSEDDDVGDDDFESDSDDDD